METDNEFDISSIQLYPYEDKTVLENLKPFKSSDKRTFKSIYNAIQHYTQTPQFKETRITTLVIIGETGAGKTTLGSDFVQHVAYDYKNVVKRTEAGVILRKYTMQWGELIKASKKEGLVRLDRQFGELDEKEFNNVSDLTLDIIMGLTRGSKRITRHLPDIKQQHKLLVVQLPAVTALPVVENGHETVSGINRGYTTIKSLSSLPEFADGLFVTGVVPDQPLREQARKIREKMLKADSPHEIALILKEFGIRTPMATEEMLAYLPTSGGGPISFESVRQGIDNLLERVCPPEINFRANPEIRTRAIGECLLPQIIGTFNLPDHRTFIGLNTRLPEVPLLDPIQRDHSLVRKLYGKKQ